MLAIVIAWEPTAQMLSVRDYQADEIECRRQYQQEHAKSFAATASDDIEAKKKAAAEADKDGRQYCVERRSAIAGERQGDTAKWAAIVSFLALGAAGLAAAAAFRTVKAMRETAEQQLRAYVFLDGINLVDASQIPPIPASSGTEGDLFVASGLKDGAPKTRPRGIPGVDWRIRNYGHTPAREVVHWGAFDIFATNEEYKATAPTLFPEVAVRTSLAPGATSSNSGWYPRILTDEEIDDVRKGKLGVYVYGKVTYKDTFGVARTTTYRLRYTGAAYPPVGNPIFNYCEEGNESD